MKHVIDVCAKILVKNESDSGGCIASFGVSPQATPRGERTADKDGAASGAEEQR